MSRQRGFTLIEVLVALAVVSIAILALAAAGSRALDAQFKLEQRTLALWVAANRIAEIELARPVRPGTASGLAPMGGADWYWRSEIRPAPGEDLWRVDVAVGADADSLLVTHSGFLAR